MARYLPEIKEFLEKNQSLIANGTHRVIRQYGKDGKSFGYWLMSMKNFIEFINARKDNMSERFRGNRFIARESCTIDDLAVSTASFDDVICMNVPHTFTADIDLSWDGDDVKKELYSSFFSCAYRGMDFLVDQLADDPDDYRAITLEDTNVVPTKFQKKQINVIWIATQLAMTIVKRTGDSMITDTYKLASIIVEAGICNRKTMKCDGHESKYSFHVKTWGQFVRDNHTAKAMAHIIESLIKIAAIVGHLDSQDLWDEFDSVGSYVKELITAISGLQIDGMEVDISHVSSLVGDHSMKSWIADMSRINMVDYGFYATRHNLRLPYEVKPGKDYYMVPFYMKTIRPPGSTPLGNSLYTMYSDTADLIIHTDVAKKKFNSEPSRPEFIKKVVEEFADDHACHLTDNFDGTWGINYSSHGHACTVCGVTHEQSTHNYLRFTGGVCFLNCWRRPYHADTAPKNVGPYAKDEGYKGTFDISNIIEEDDGGDDDDDVHERILETRRTIMYTHNVQVFKAPTLDERDNMGDDDDYSEAINVTPNKTGMTYIRSALGTGKTKWLLRDIADTIRDSPDHRFYVVTVRRTQTDAFMKKYNEYLSAEGISKDSHFVSYADVNVNDDNNLFIQVDSFIKFTASTFANKKYTVILDEAVSILEQTQSDNIREYSAVCDVFRVMIGYAEKVILMDGYIIGETIECYDKIRGMMTSARARIGRVPDPKPLVYVNTYRPQEDRVYRVTTSKDIFISYLAHVAMDKRVVVATNSLESCKVVMKMISEAPDLKGKNIKMYTSETSGKEKAEAFKDVNESWKQADILVYSPTIGAGISFEVPRHFDYLFGYCTCGSTTAETFVQILNRVRDIHENEACLYIDPMKAYGVHTTYEALRAAIVDDDCLVGNVRKTIDDEGNTIIADECTAAGILRMYATTHANRSSASLLRRVVKLLMHLSRNVEAFGKLPKGIRAIAYDELKKAAKMDDYDRFDETPILPREVYRELKEAKKNNACTYEEGLSVNKTAIMRRYKMCDDFTKYGWAAEYLPFIEKYGERLQYLPEVRCNPIEIVETVKEQVIKSDGTVVSETIDKMTVIAAVGMMADFMGVRDLALSGDRRDVYTVKNEVTAKDETYSIVSRGKSVKAIGRDDWEEFVKTAYRFTDKTMSSIAPKKTKLLSGKATRWVSEYNKIYDEIIGYLTGAKKAAKTLHTLHIRILKGIMGFFGVDVIETKGSGGCSLTFFRNSPIRFGSKNHEDDDESWPKFIPIIDDEGHKIKRMTGKATLCG